MLITDLKCRMIEMLNERRREAILIVTTPELWDSATIELAWRFLRANGAKPDDKPYR